MPKGIRPGFVHSSPNDRQGLRGAGNLYRIDVDGEVFTVEPLIFVHTHAAAMPARRATATIRL
jgi:hypothetical protein